MGRGSLVGFAHYVEDCNMTDHQSQCNYGHCYWKQGARLFHLDDSQRAVSMRAEDFHRRGVELPIYGDMKHWLEMQKAPRNQDKKYSGCPWVFHFRGRRIGSHLKGWHKACKDVGLVGLLFHDLRRSAVRNMERAGIPRKIAMGISGHKTESVYRRYGIVSRQDLATAAARMEAYLGTISCTNRRSRSRSPKKKSLKP